MVLGRGEKPVVYYFGRGIFNFLWVKYVFIDFCSFYAYLSLPKPPPLSPPCLFVLQFLLHILNQSLKTLK